MKKIISLVLIFAITLCLFGCKKETTYEGYEFDKDRIINPDITSIVSDNDKEIKISYTLAGYGEEWIKEAVKAFNRVYEGHGYKAVLGRSDAAFTTDSVELEIKYPEGNDYDLYFTISSNLLTTIMDSSYAVMKDRNKSLLVDLTDLLDEKPIDLYGYEEDYKIGECLNDTTIMFDTYTSTPDSKWYGKMYGLQWTRSISGLAINMDVLEQYGFTEAPRTTTELFEMCDYVKNNPKNSELTGELINPVTWAGANATGYFEYPILTWMAQYFGQKGYENFYSFTPETGTTYTNGYDVYNNIGIQYAFESVRKLVNQDYATNGTVTTVDHLTSNQILADGEALFCVTGDWCYNEIIGCDYEDSELTGIKMLSVPVLSELADLVGFTGTADEKDALLSTVIKYIDQNKSASEVIAAVQSELGKTVTEEQVNRIGEARGAYYDLGTGHNCFIPAYSDNIEGAKLFLRFVISQEFGEEIYARYAHSITANTKVNATQSNFIKSISAISGNQYSFAIGSEDKLSPIRMNGGLGFVFEPYTHWINIVKSMAVGDANYTGQTIYETVKNSMKSNWSTTLSAAGIEKED